MSFLAVFLSFNVQAHTVKICLDGDQFSHKLAKYILQHVYEEAGFEPRFLSFPSKRSLEVANSGQCDAEAARIPEAITKFTNLALTSTPLLSSSAYAYIKKGANIAVAGKQDFKGLRVAIVRGELYALKLTEGIKPLIVKDYATLFRVLQANRVDVVIGIREAALDVLVLKQFRHRFQRLPTVLYKTEAYHLIQKDNIKLRAAIDKVLADWQKSGKLQALFVEALRRQVDM